MNLKFYGGLRKTILRLKHLKIAKSNDVTKTLQKKCFVNGKKYS